MGSSAQKDKSPGHQVVDTFFAAVDVVVNLAMGK